MTDEEFALFDPRSRRTWPGATDERFAAISSRINAARKAIGDSGNHQVFIRTFHKRGFRFVGEVDEVPDSTFDRKSRRVTERACVDGPVNWGGSNEDGAAFEPASDRHKPSIAVLRFDNVSKD